MKLQNTINSGLLGMSALAGNVAFWNYTADYIGSGMATAGALVTALIAGKTVVVPAMEWLYHKTPGKHAVVGTTGLALLTVAAFFAMPGSAAEAEVGQWNNNGKSSLEAEFVPLSDARLMDSSLDDVVDDREQIYSRQKAREVRVGRRGIEDRVPLDGSLLPHDTIAPLYRALLDTIAFAEGTMLSGAKKGVSSYTIMLGGRVINDLSAHPRKTGEMPRRGFPFGKAGKTSTAAGRYQFLGSTYDQLHNKGLFQTGFTPEDQDRAALYLVRRCGVTEEMLQNAVESREFGGVWDRLAGQWASLPRVATGLSHYNQRTERSKYLENVYVGFLAQHNARR